jgi:hypothetical protein
MLQSFAHYTHFGRGIKAFVGWKAKTSRQKASAFSHAIADDPLDKVLEPHPEAEVLKETAVPAVSLDEHTKTVVPPEGAEIVDGDEGVVFGGKDRDGNGEA